MTFLPIVERELRVASRRRSTYWLRIVAAGVALIIGSGMLLLTLVPFFGTTQSGGAMFSTLTWMSLAVALSAGLFFTSDCLSEEKRDGTLGFLFLTDLRGYDVVLGKLLATSLRSVSPLLAIFPILATTQLMGGVEVGQFWRTLLAIGNAAFFSLTVGLFVSTISQQSLKALAGTLALLVLFVGFGPSMDSLGSIVNGRFVPRLSLASPGYAFVTANYDRTFWPALMVSQAVGWTLLGSACVLVRRTWQERPAQFSVTSLYSRYARRASGSARSRLRREKLLEKNPVTWLVARDCGQSVAVWAVALVVLAGFLILVLADLSAGWWQGWAMINSSLWLVSYLWVAAKACQFFAEARRSGMIELLIASPLTSRETVQGAWQGVVKLFALPVLLLVCLQLVGSFINNTGLDGFMGGGDGLNWLGAVAVVVSGVVVPVNLMTLGWFGLWMGLTSKNALSATLKTIVFVQIIPWFVIYMITVLIMPLMLIFNMKTKGGSAPAPSVMTFWLPLLFVIVPAVLGLAKNLFLWRLAEGKLCGKFRQLAVRSVVPIHVSDVPPVIPPAS